VSVLRTLELCDVYCLIEEKNLAPKDLMKLVKAEVGWLNITASGFEVTNS